MRVLIAGCDATLLEELQACFWSCEHDAEIAENAIECVTILRQFAPKLLVIVDELLWGGADGVIAFMLEDPKLSKTRVVFLSSADGLRSSATTLLLRVHLRLRELLARLEIFEKLNRMDEVRSQSQLSGSMN